MERARAAGDLANFDRTIDQINRLGQDYVPSEEDVLDLQTYLGSATLSICKSSEYRLFTTVERTAQLLSIALARIHVFQPGLGHIYIYDVKGGFALILESADIGKISRLFQGNPATAGFFSLKPWSSIPLYDRVVSQ